jgi:hypothetical protein
MAKKKNKLYLWEVNSVSGEVNAKNIKEAFVKSMADAVKCFPYLNDEGDSLEISVEPQSEDEEEED